MFWKVMVVPSLNVTVPLSSPSVSFPEPPLKYWVPLSSSTTHDWVVFRLMVSLSAPPFNQLVAVLYGEPNMKSL